MKPDRGSASKGLTVAHSAAELATHLGSGMVVQELVVGDEFTVDTLVAADGQPLAAVPRRRLEIRAGEVSKGLTERVPDIADLAARVAAALPGTYGPLNIQILRARYRCAVGPRTERSLRWRVSARGAAGAAFHTWLLEEALLGAGRCPHEWQAGVLMLRYDDAIFLEDASATDAPPCP